MENLFFGSVTNLASEIRNKKVSSTAVVTAYLDRIEDVNPKINAIVHLRAKEALDEARKADEELAHGDVKGPLHGIPVTIKDSFETEGVITSAGTPGLATYVPEQDATVVDRLRSAGAILLGKTNTPELTLTAMTDNYVYGRTNNPYDPDRTPGGSSGGPAAAVAAGCTACDVGSDMGGSIRIPAHCCGVTAIKPTAGRVPRTGHIPFLDLGGVQSFVQVGPLARSVSDLDLLLSALAGPDSKDPDTVPMPLRDRRSVQLRTMRIAYYVDNGRQSPSSDTVDVLEVVRRALSARGVDLVEDRPPRLETAPDLWRELVTADGGARVRDLLDALGTRELHPLLDWTQRGEDVHASTFAGMLTRWNEFRAANLAFLGRYDAIIAPAASHPAHRHAEPIPFTYTQAFNLLGWPVAVVRCGTCGEDLPIGIQVIAHPWREDIALAIAEYLESELGGWQAPSIAP